MQILRFLLILTFCFLSKPELFSQDLHQNISGKIINSSNEQPIEGANITIINSSPALGTSSDKKGNFKIEKVPVGRYTILIQHISYQQKQLFDIVVISAKETQLYISLTPQSQLIKSIEITGKIEPIQTLNAHTFTASEVNRYAATYNDPARLATSLSGISTVNDQSNHVSVQGNSPNANAWYLNGLALPNPNHLSNAGTFSDQPSTSGGGVNILSSQLLSHSVFHKGNYPLHFSNALGGVYDMHFRKGSANKHRYTIQAGLIGIEASAEGPLSKARKNSFLTNYRYSTVGLLTQAGVDFGNEKINYHDLSFHLNFELDSINSQFSAFGLFGTSKNDHKIISDDDEINSDKDLQQIYYDDINAALGFTFTKKFTKSIFNVGVLGSLHNADRNAIITLDKNNPIRKEDYLQEESNISFTATYKYYISSNASVFIGNMAEISSTTISYTTQDSIQSDYSYLTRGENEMLFNSNFIQFYFNLSKKLYLELGWKSIQHFTNHKAGKTLFGNDYLVERSSNEIIPIQPQAKIGYRIAKNQLVEFNWQSNSQKQTAATLYALPNIAPQNLKLKSTKNNIYNIIYVNNLTNNLKYSSQVYFQEINDVPIALNNNRIYSTLNNHAQIIDQSLENRGAGCNYGLDLSLQKEFSNKYYLITNVSVYNSTFEDAGNKNRSTTYDGRYLVNLTAGYEKPREKNKNSFIGANFRLFNQGGYRHTPIDITASQLANKTVFIESETNSLQYPDYFRIDAGIRLIKNKNKATRTWSIDIQNITNNNNVAYKYYDIYFKKIKTKYHLGIIPVFTYKIEF